MEGEWGSSQFRRGEKGRRLTDSLKKRLENQLLFQRARTVNNALTGEEEEKMMFWVCVCVLTGVFPLPSKTTTKSRLD